MGRSSTRSPPSALSASRRRFRQLRVLITGAAGFAGGWLARECVATGDEVVALSRDGNTSEGWGTGVAADLRDAGATRAALRDARPEIVYHLAALSSVGDSWKRPAQTISENVEASVNLLEALRHEAPTARVVWVSSCQVYGEPQQVPVDEDAPLRPENPYGVSKTAGDLLAGVYAEAHGLDLVRARPFNHIGPGQRDAFIASSLARQAAQARAAGADQIDMVTGSPDARRDYTDVRDVVRAYRLLAGAAVAGVVNVSSGRSVSAAELVRLLGEVIAPIRVTHKVDPARVRAHEVMDLSGSHARLTAVTGWEPTIPLAQTLHDTIEWWERELGPDGKPETGLEPVT
jgi:GDP-4-dehydro-6-deoxy-D-mannose reductase